MPTRKLPDLVIEFFRLHGRAGGKAAAKNMTAAQRRARAKKAAKASAAARAQKKTKER